MPTLGFNKTTKIIFGKTEIWPFTLIINVYLHNNLKKIPFEIRKSRQLYRKLRSKEPLKLTYFAMIQGYRGDD